MGSTDRKGKNMKLKKILGALTASALIIVSGIMPSSLIGYDTVSANTSEMSVDSDTSIVLPNDSVTLDYNYDTYYDVTGTITGDTGSEYYVYGVDDKDIVRTDSPAVKDCKFTIRLTPNATGSTSLRINVKDKATSKVVATAMLNVTIKKADFSKTKLSVDPSALTVEEGKTASVKVSLENWPDKSMKKYFIYSSGDKSIASVKWDNTADPLTITGIKQGKTTVKVRLVSYYAKKDIKEISFDVTVTEKDIYTNMKFSVSNKSLLLNSGEVERINIKADNIPSDGSIKFFCGAKMGYKDAAWTEWDKVTKSENSMSADLIVYGMDPGQRTITVSVKDARTERILRTQDIILDSIQNFSPYRIVDGNFEEIYYSRYEDAVAETVDLKGGSTFKLGLCSVYYDDFAQTVTADTPTGITLKNVEKKFYDSSDYKNRIQLYDCTFTASKTGKYKIPVYINLTCKNTTLQTGVVYYEVEVTDSGKPAVSTASTAASTENTTTVKTTSARGTTTSETSSGELLGETSFDEKAEPWEICEQAPAKQTYSVENGSLHIKVIKAMGKEEERWDLQLHHRHLDFKAGHSYKVSFKAKAKRSGMELFTKLSNIDGDEEYFSSHGSKMELGPALDGKWGSVLTLDSSYKTFSGIFTPARDISDAEWTFHYAYGNNYGGNAVDGDEIWFDEMSIIDTAAEVHPAVTTTVTSLTTAATTAKAATTTAVTTTTTAKTTAEQVTAHEMTEGYNGECGKNAKWTLNEKTGELLIYGEGEIQDYDSGYDEWGDLTDKIKSLKIDEGITSVGSHAFSGLLCIKKIELPSTLTAIKSHAFFAVGSNDIILPDSVTEVEDNAFAMSSIKYARLSTSMAEIPEDMFNECVSLKSIEIPYNITKIGKTAFAYCKELESVEIPDSVTTICSGAFGNCSKLASITVEYPKCIIEDVDYFNTLGTDETIIKGYVDSTAYKYAEAHSVTFMDVESETVYEFGQQSGDANGDGKVNVRDAAYIAAKLAHGKADELSSFADFNGDGKINVRDAAAIAKFLATGKK